MVEDDSFVIYVTTPLKVQYVLGKFFIHNVSGCVALENKTRAKGGSCKYDTTQTRMLLISCETLKFYRFIGEILLKSVSNLYHIYRLLHAHDFLCFLHECFLCTLGVPENW